MASRSGVHLSKLDGPCMPRWPDGAGIGGILTDKLQKPLRELFGGIRVDRPGGNTSRVELADLLQARLIPASGRRRQSASTFWRRGPMI